MTKSRKKNKVKYPRSILIGHLPPPLTGQSAAFSTAIKFFQEKSLPFVVVDIAGKVSQRPIGQFAWGRVWEISQSLLIFIKHVWRTNQVVYLSIALSPVGFFRDLLFIWIASLFHHRIVLHLHGGGYSYFIQSQRKIFQNLITNTIGQAHKIVVLTEQMKEQFQFLPTSRSQIVVVPNCLPYEFQGVSTHRLRQQRSTLRVLFLSNLIETKGYWDLLSAVLLLREKGLNIYADFCGGFINSVDATRFKNIDDAQAAFLEAIADPLLSTAVNYYGVVSGKQKEKMFINADVFVLPTYYIYEGQPIAIIEALAYALPIISTPYRGIKELVYDGLNGFLVSPNSPTDIADRLERLYKSPNLYEIMSKASLDQFTQSYERKHVADKLIQAILGDIN